MSLCPTLAVPQPSQKPSVMVLELLCTFPHVPFSTHHACFLSSSPSHDLSGILPARTAPIPCHFCLHLAFNVLQQRAKQMAIPPPKWHQPHPCQCNKCTPGAACIPLMLCSNLAAPSVATAPHDCLTKPCSRQ